MATLAPAVVLTHDELEAKMSITEPKEDERFYPSRIVKVVRELFEDRLRGVEYDANQANTLCERLVVEIKEKIRREVRIPRYKVGVQLVLGEIKGQGLRIASKCLWDPQNDNYASYTFTSDKLYCTAIVFGCYFE